VGLGSLVIAAAAFWLIRGSHPHGAQGPPAQARINAQTNRGDVSECAISKDGRYLAYIPSQGGIAGVHVRQVATGSDVEVVPALKAQIYGLTFSPDGDYLYYLGPKQDSPRYRALYQVPSLGGHPVEKTFDVDTRVSFAPDGKQCCFMRGQPQKAADDLIVCDLESGKERVLAIVSHVEKSQAWTSPAWSPDGKSIVLGEQRFVPKTHSLINRYPVSGGPPTVVADLPQFVIEDIAWVPDGKSLAVTGTDETRGFTPQVSLVSMSGEIRPVTNDVSSYGAVSVSAGEEAIAVQRLTRLGNLWMADAAGGPAVQVTHMTNSENALIEIGLGDSSTMTYIAGEGGGLPVYAVPVSGGEPHRLTEPDLRCTNLVGFSGGAAYSQFEANGDVHIWAVRLDGSGKRQLTKGMGENLLDVTPDGRYFTYQDQAGILVSQPMAGGPATQFHAVGSTEPARNGGGFSPDGKWMHFSSNAAVDGLQRIVLHVVPAGGGAEARADTLPPGASRSSWGPTIESATYQTAADPANLYWRTPGRTELRALTDFKEGRIIQWIFSPDRRHLALSRLIGAVGNLWVCDAEGGHPVQVTHFTDGRVFQFRWMTDNRRIAVLAGPRSGDAVLIKSFR
jgi:Tol biopolymer transport system component